MEQLQSSIPKPYNITLVPKNVGVYEKTRKASSLRLLYNSLPFYSVCECFFKTNLAKRHEKGVFNGKFR
jgi:hypothetical protein